MPISRQSAIALLGLGQMGRRMAVHLRAAYPNRPFIVADASPDAIASFLANSRKSDAIRVASSPADMVAQAAVVVSMLPSTPQVRAVYLGPNGFRQALEALPPDQRSQSVFIDATTLAVDAARDVAAQITGTGATMVDAPVSGGVAGAEAATLAFLVGGTKDAFTKVSPYLHTMGKRIIHCGPSGAGLAAKICNNLILGIHQIATAEAMLLGQALGLDPRVLATVINSSTGASWSSSVNNPVVGALEPPKHPPCERDFAGGFATALMLKDMGLATDIATKTGSPVPLGESARQLYQSAIMTDTTVASKDFSSIYNFLKSVKSK